MPCNWGPVRPVRPLPMERAFAPRARGGAGAGVVRGRWQDKPSAPPAATATWADAAGTGSGQEGTYGRGLSGGDSRCGLYFFFVSVAPKTGRRPTAGCSAGPPRAWPLPARADCAHRRRGWAAAVGAPGWGRGQGMESPRLRRQRRRQQAAAAVASRRLWPHCCSSRKGAVGQSGRGSARSVADGHRHRCWWRTGAAWWYAPWEEESAVRPPRVGSCRRSSAGRAVGS